MVSTGTHETEQGSTTPAAAGGGVRPLPSRRSMRVGLLVLFGCLAIWVWRRPEQAMHPYLWAEESVIVGRFLDAGWIGALHPLSGYMILPTTLLLPLAATVSFSHLAALEYVFATAVFALTVWLLIVPRSRWGGQRTRVLMAFAMVLCPANPETFGILLYSFWWATLWPVIILGWKRNLWWARVPLLVIAGLSSPAGAAMAVPFAVSWWFTRRRSDLFGAGILAGSVLIQAAALMTSDRGGGAVSATFDLPSVLRQCVRTGGLFATGWTASAHGDHRFVAFVGVAVFGALTIAAVYALRRRRGVEPVLLLVTLALFTAVSSVPAPLRTDPENTAPRYYFLPFILILWLLVHLGQRAILPKPARLVAGALAGLSILGLSTTFSRPTASTTGHLNWRQELVVCAESDSAVVGIPIYTDGAMERLVSLDMTPAECAAHL